MHRKNPIYFGKITLLDKEFLHRGNQPMPLGITGVVYWNQTTDCYIHCDRGIVLHKLSSSPKYTTKYKVLYS